MWHSTQTSNLFLTLFKKINYGRKSLLCFSSWFTLKENDSSLIKWLNNFLNGWFGYKHPIHVSNFNQSGSAYKISEYN